MGQQQLLLIILGVIIVGIAVAVAITIFNDHLIQANRDDLQNDLSLIATRAQEYYFRPLPMSGGGHSFVGLTADAAGMIKIVGQEFSDNEHGTYTVQAAGTTSLVILQAIGKVQLPDGTFPTYYCRVRERKYLTQLIN
jgi:hypothetical protein